jgi:chorismate-pyruvate lyase
MALALIRHLFSNHPADARWLNVLLTQDGSTTRLCSAMLGASVQIHVHQQHVVNAVHAHIIDTLHQTAAPQIPTEVAALLGGTAWLQRITSLHDAQGNVLMDNLSFTCLDATPAWFMAALKEGTMPIGQLLDRLFIKRQAVSTTGAVHNLLWNAVGLPDSRASRSYQVATPEGAFMLIFEVFRGGLEKI